MIQPLWKTVWRFLKKLGIKPPYDPAIPLLGIYQRKTQFKIHVHPAMFTVATGATWKQHKCLSTEEWIRKMWRTHTDAIVLGHKKE